MHMIYKIIENLQNELCVIITFQGCNESLSRFYCLNCICKKINLNKNSRIEGHF